MDGSSNGKKDLLIEVASDLVCPWCYVGKRKLDRAIEMLSDRYNVRVQWLPFQLDPSVPQEGRPYRAGLEKKFGGAARVQAMFDRLTSVGRDTGIAFALDKQTTMPNTLDGHRLMHWAGLRGDATKLGEALFAAHFTEGRNTADREELATIAASVGYDRAEVMALLQSDQYEREVRASIDEIVALGVNSVPVFLVDRRYAVVGAQPPEAIVSLVERATATAS